MEDAKERKKIFDGFLAKARSFGKIRNSTILWTAWKMVVWPYIQEQKAK